jgi:hypothetical protein
VTKPTLRYVDFYNGYCMLSTDSVREIMREHGNANVKHVRNATRADVEWFKAMHGRVPDGRVRAAPS